MLFSPWPASVHSVFSNDHAMKLHELFVLMTGLSAGYFAGCNAVVPPFESPREAQPEPDRSTRLYKTLVEIDSRFDLGRLREAIELAESSMAQFSDSADLRDRLSAFRSIRQVRFENDLSVAQESLETGAPHTAVARLDEIEGYGDSDMIKTARFEREKIAATFPAIFSEELER